jgi:hypothetical protein
MSLSNYFPILPPKDALLAQKVKAVNDIRLGFLDPKETNGLERISKVNSALAEILPELPDEEAFVLMENLSQAYAYVKVWLETKRKKKIKLEVDEREQRKLEAALAERDSSKKRKAKSAATTETATSSKRVYCDDPTLNKTITEFVKVARGNVSAAVATLKSLGILSADFEVKEG